jgi:hypothetical protein
MTWALRISSSRLRLSSGPAIKHQKGVIETESGHESLGKLASGVHYVGSYVFRGHLWGYGHLGHDMLHLWELKNVRESEKRG